jgi:hypothetical protein
MIAFYKNDLKGSKIMTPSLKPVQLHIGMTMEKVADHNKLLWFEMMQQVYQALQIFFINGLRNSNTRLAKVARLAKMQVGNDQRFLLFPKDGTLGREPEVLIVDFM